MTERKNWGKNDAAYLATSKDHQKNSCSSHSLVESHNLGDISSHVITRIPDLTGFDNETSPQNITSLVRGRRLVLHWNFTFFKKMSLQKWSACIAIGLVFLMVVWNFFGGSTQHEIAYTDNHQHEHIDVNLTTHQGEKTQIPSFLASDGDMNLVFGRPEQHNPAITNSLGNQSIVPVDSYVSNAPQFSANFVPPPVQQRNEIDAHNISPWDRDPTTPMAPNMNLSETPQPPYNNQFLSESTHGGSYQSAMYANPGQAEVTNAFTPMATQPSMATVSSTPGWQGAHGETIPYYQSPNENRVSAGNMAIVTNGGGNPNSNTVAYGNNIPVTNQVVPGNTMPNNMIPGNVVPGNMGNQQSPNMLAYHPDQTPYPSNMVNPNMNGSNMGGNQEQYTVMPNNPQSPNVIAAAPRMQNIPATMTGNVYQDQTNQMIQPYQSPTGNYNPNNIPTGSGFPQSQPQLYNDTYMRR